MSAVACSRCGTIAPVGAEYCVACGWSLRGDVRPLPEAASPRSPRGPLGRRLVAWSLDALIRLIAASAGWIGGSMVAQEWSPDRPDISLLLRIVGAALLAALTTLALVTAAGASATPGMRAVGIGLRTAWDDGPIGFWHSLGRAVLFSLACAIVVGPFTVFFDADRQGWHGRATGTRAVLLQARTDRAPSTATVERPEVDEEPSTVLAHRRADEGWVLELDDGRTFPMRGPVLLGRDPAPQEGERIAGLVPMGDSDRSVSKTHARLDVDAAGLWVTDRWSTNGSAVMDGSVRRNLQPAERVRLAPGAVLVLGDRRILVSRSPDA